MNLNKYITEDIASNEHPSDFIKHSNTLILRLPFLKNSDITIKSIAFIVDDDKIYEYDREKQNFILIGTFTDFHKKLDLIIDNLLDSVKKLFLKIDKLEESMYESKYSDIMHNWLQYKKSFSLIRRLIFHASVAFDLFLLNYKSNENLDIYAYEDIKEHIERIKNLAISAEDKLDSLHDFYKMQVDEKMNKNVYYLTIISGIFLPLTLITGFFGMNSGGLPWTNNPNGTLYVTILSLIVEVLFFVGFFLLLRKDIKNNPPREGN